MAWPSGRRELRSSRVALAAARRVGQPTGLDPWGRPWDLQSEGQWNLDNPPAFDSPPTFNPPPGAPCGPPGRVDIPEPMPGCPVYPGSLRYMAQTVTIQGNGGTGTFTFDSPGIFCPQRLIIMSDDVELMFVLSIKAGTRNQIISGLVPAEIFGTENTCCPISCLDCLCAPGVQLVIEIGNTDTTPEDVTVVVIGAYYDLLPGMSPKQSMQELPIQFPGCPMPGRDKLVGVNAGVFTTNVQRTVEIETPGRFCPRQLFLSSTSTTGQLNPISFIEVVDIRTATDGQIIEGPVPGALWSVQNKCCVMSCLPCLCMPGVPLLLTLRSTIPAEEEQTVVAALIGDFEEAC